MNGNEWGREVEEEWQEGHTGECGEKRRMARDGQRGYERNGFNIVNYGSRDW